MQTKSTLPAAALLAVLALATPAAEAAESYDSCTGFITSVPATITTQGTWCLKQDLASTLASGKLITIAANNVTIDCNGFKLGGLGAGPATNATGIGGSSLANTVVRHCNLRGFRIGISLYGSTPTVEDNRLDGMTEYGLDIHSDQATIRHNRVFDTGGGAIVSIGIRSAGSADIVDNVVDTVTPEPFGYAYGIHLDNFGGSVVGNRVRDVVADPDGASAGIAVRNGAATRVVVSGNLVQQTAGLPAGAPIYCGAVDAPFFGNVTVGFDQAVVDCGDDGGNVLN